MTKSGKLTPKDLLVYLTIKSFMNKDSKECFPSLDTIVKISGISKPTVRKSIELLKTESYISVRLQGRSNVYKFNPYKSFEPFSYDFIKDERLEASVKAYIAALQQSMFKDQKGFGKISYSDTEISEIINLDKRTIAKYDKQLEEMGLLTIVKTNKKDEVTGIKVNEKIFHLDELGQSIIWALQKHEEDINDLKQQTSSTSKDIEILTKDVRRIEEENKRIKENNERMRTIMINAGLDPNQELTQTVLI
jgi:predicted transcriptional regulator